MDTERMRERRITFSQRRPAILKVYRLEFNKVASRNPEEGYANVVQYENGVVEGVLYDIRDSDLAKLDRCEGYPEHYDRVKVKVRIDDKHEMKAVTYVARPSKIRYGLRPSRDYPDHLLAAKDLLSESYSRMLVAVQTVEE